MDKALKKGFLGHASADEFHASMVQLVSHAGSSSLSEMQSHLLNAQSFSRFKERLLAFKNAITAHQEFDLKLESFLETIDVDDYPDFAARLHTLAHQLGDLEHRLARGYKRYVSQCDK
jgi:hypothetical protein